MRVFVTGATGFIGTELVKELIAVGHQVRGLTRSDAGAEQLKAAGAEVHRGNLQDIESLRRGATGMDAVVNLAFNHDDMSKFVQNAKDEIQAIEALGSVIEPGKLLVVTPGSGIQLPARRARCAKRPDPPTESTAMPRRSETGSAGGGGKGRACGSCASAAGARHAQARASDVGNSDRAREGCFGVCGRWHEPLGGSAVKRCGAPVSSGGRARRGRA